MNPHRKAFTLLELMVVVVLVGLAATIVAVQLRGASDQARLRAAALTIGQNLRLARYRAMTRHAPTWLAFRIGSDRMRLVFASNDEHASGAWHSLDGVTIARATLRGGRPRTGAEDAFAVRLTPSGASLPWALELRLGSHARVVWSDGVSGRLEVVEDTSLAEFTWPATERLK